MRDSSANSVESLQYSPQSNTFNLPLSSSSNKDFASFETSGIVFFSVDFSLSAIQKKKVRINKVKEKNTI